MKRFTFILLSVLLLLSLSLPAFAVESDLPPVVDYAGLLSQAEAEDLAEKIGTLRSRLEMDIVIVTTYGTDRKGVQAFADDFYDNNGYGYGSNNTGILLLLDMDAREWYMSTCGDAIYIFTDYGLDQLGETILPWLSSGYYYEAFHTWLSELPRYVDAFRNQSPIDGYVQPDDYESPYGEEIYYYDDHMGIRIPPFPMAMIIGLVAAVIIILTMRSQMNTARKQSGAIEYLKPGSFRLHQRSDVYLYSRVTKTEKPQSSSSGGGSSVHRSSGGVHHGGRGGKF